MSKSVKFKRFLFNENNLPKHIHINFHTLYDISIFNEGKVNSAVMKIELNEVSRLSNI